MTDTTELRVWMRGLGGRRIDTGFHVRDDLPRPMLCVEVHGILPGTVVFAPVKDRPGEWRVGLYAFPEKEPRRVEVPKWVADGDGGHHEVQIIRSASHPDEDRLTLCVEGL